jgi:hypothetical protein
VYFAELLGRYAFMLMILSGQGKDDREDRQNQNKEAVHADTPSFVKLTTCHLRRPH